MSRLWTLGLLISGAAWISAVALGLGAITRYENTPGVAAGAPATWPSASRIVRHKGRFALVLFAHPECPCTRASLSELGGLLAGLGGRLDTAVEFRKPGMTLIQAQSTELWRAASGLPGTAAALDSDGNEMRAFGAAVSGQAMLYDPDGQLIFTGGLTFARGHVGSNKGVDAVRGLVMGQISVGETGAGGRSPATALRTPVFGCSLLAPSSSEASAWTL